MSARSAPWEPSSSISDSMRCARSPRRMAPASRALPLSVCSVRSTEARGAASSGWCDHWRSASPSWGISSAASSSKIGNRSTSTASARSMASSLSSSTTSAKASLATTCLGSSVSKRAAAISGGIGAAAISRSACSVASDGSRRKPTANWCSRRRSSSAAATSTTPCSRVPLPCICRCCSADSSRRAMPERLWKPTVAELPASECASAMVESGRRSWVSSAHSPTSVASWRDHSSASLR
ncbi:hypothetical protein FQZ97_788530 [compost metagenome]